MPPARQPKAPGVAQLRQQALEPSRALTPLERLPNPAQTSDERQREERPFGWASLALSRARAAAWKLFQNGWMISPLSWESAAPGDVRRQCLEFLFRLGYMPADRINEYYLDDASGSANELLTVLTNIRNHDDKAFVAEREMLAQCTKLRLDVPLILETASWIPKANKKQPLAEALFRLRAQELSLEVGSLLSDTLLPLEPWRKSLWSNRRAVLLQISEAAGYLGQMRLVGSFYGPEEAISLRQHIAPDMLLYAPFFQSPHSDKLDVMGFAASLTASLDNVRDFPETPLNLWIRESIADRQHVALESLPLVQRANLEHLALAGPLVPEFQSLALASGPAQLAASYTSFTKGKAAADRDARRITREMKSWLKARGERLDSP